jgi:predicted nucleotidyltransferase
MDQSEVLTKVRLFGERVRNRFPVKEIILYGSYVNGHPTEDSDIDVAVVLEKEPEGNFLEASAELFGMRRTIDLRIEPILLVENHDESGFISEIKQYGSIID